MRTAYMVVRDAVSLWHAEEVRVEHAVVVLIAEDGDRVGAGGDVRERASRSGQACGHGHEPGCLLRFPGKSVR